MKPSQLKAFLVKMIEEGLNVLITGAPGVGKSDIVEQARKDAGADLILSHPAVEDPTVPAGLPMASPGDTEARFLPFGHLAKAMKAKKRTAWFLDDLGQASQAVQAAYMQLLLAGQVNGHVLPKHVSFVAATNRRTDRAGVSGILEPVKSRFAAIVSLEPDLNDWCNWAFGAGIDPILIAFLRYRPQLLSAFQATADLVNSPMPRTWAHLDKLSKLGLPSDIESEAFSGAVGAGAATEFLAFRLMFNQLVNLDAILIDPKNVQIPDKIDQLYATVTGLARKANPKNFDRIATYATRLATENIGGMQRGEFATLLVRDAQRHDDAVMRTAAFVQLQSGPVGQLIQGTNL